MKKNLIYLGLLALFFLACTSNDDQEFELKDISDLQTSIQLLEINLSASESVPITYQRHELLQIEGEIYLRSHSKEYITTSLLEKDLNNGLRFVGISCSSRHCSSTTGCVPDPSGKSCSDCHEGDCTKTVTGGGIL